jgi:hypothetical protein
LFEEHEVCLKNLFLYTGKSDELFSIDVFQLMTKKENDVDFNYVIYLRVLDLIGVKEVPIK